MKHLKKLLFLGAVLCLVLGIAACTDNGDPTPGDKPVTYTVTVTCEDELTLETIQVKMMSGTTEVAKKAVEKNGDVYSAVFSLAPTNYTAELEGMLDNFTYTPAALTPISTSATIALVKKGAEEEPDPAEKIDYSVTVKLPNGDPVGNLNVQLCGGPLDTCTQGTTDASGVARFKLAAGNYEVHIESDQWPENYLFDDKEFTIGSAGGNVDVTFHEAQTYTVTVVYAGNLLTGTPEKPAVGFTVGLFKETNDEDNGLQIATEPTCTGTTDANGVAELVAFGGDAVYVVRIIDCPIEYGYQDTLSVEVSAPEVKLELTELGTSLYKTITVGVGTYAVNITADRKEYYYDFDPAGKAGYYRISSSGTYKDTDGTEKDVDAKVERYSGTFAYVNPTPKDTCDDISDSNVHFSMEFLITPKEIVDTATLGNKWIFKVSALTTIFGNETRPFKITFEYVREYVAPTEKTETPNATQTLSDLSGYTQPAETTWTWLQPGITLAKDTNGIYHLNSATGPVVYAAVAGTKYIPQGMDANFAAAIAQGNTAFQYSTGVADEHNVITTYLLTTFFTDYASAANDDGLHPLTEELKLALQAYCVHNGIYAADGVGWNKDNDQLFLFACGYFKSDYATPLSGEGAEDSPYILNGETAYGTYKFTMPASGKLYFATRLGGTITFTCDATLKIGEDTYTKDDAATFEPDSSHTKFCFELTAGSELKFVFAPELGSESNPIALTLGENSINVPESKTFDGVWYRFTPETSGLYKISTTSQSAAIENPDGYFGRIEGAGEAVLEFIANKAYFIVCSIAPDETVEAYTLTIARESSATPAGGNGSEATPYTITDEGWYRVSTKSQDGVYGEYFEFNARTEGHWQITVYSPDAVVLYYAPNDTEGISASLGDDEPFFTIDIETTLLTTGVYKFFMGTYDFAVHNYFFHFGEAPQESEPGPGGEGGGSGESGNWEGSGTEYDPYVLTNIVSTFTVHIGTVNDYEDPYIYFSFTATETATYNFTASENAQISISFLNGDVPSTLKDIDEDNGLTGSFTMTQGVAYTITVMDWYAVGDCDVTLTITKA